MDPLKLEFYRMTSSEEPVPVGMYKVKNEGVVWSAGFFSCQGILLFSDINIGLAHFTYFNDFNKKLLDGMLKDMGNENMSYILISGLKSEHELWVSELDKKGIRKINEFNDDYNTTANYNMKSIAATKDRFILHTYPILRHDEERFIRLL